jgi:hypothetical protein
MEHALDGSEPISDQSDVQGAGFVVSTAQKFKENMP